MKTLFLHLSDLHISSKTDIHMQKVEKIVQSLNPLDKFDALFLIISGDIAATGNENEYRLADKFIASFITEFQKVFSHVSTIFKIFVPGNHDVDFKKGDDLGRPMIEELYKNNSLDVYMKSELSKQTSFYNFARKHLCFLDKSMPLICRRILRVGEKFIEARLINSAIFSTKDRDEGLHYLPEPVLELLNAPSRADYCIAIMHHAPQYFPAELKNLLEEALYSNCDFVFLGHEHYQIGKAIELDGSGNHAMLLANGALNSPDDDKKSEYYSIVLDLTDSKYSICDFKWVDSKSFYLHSLRNEHTILRNISNDSSFTISRDFVDTIKFDEKNSICDDLNQYFVFPRLQEEQIKENRAISAEYVSLDEFLAVIETKKRIIIDGNDNSGKSALFKQLFRALANDKTTLFVSADNIRGKTADKMIRSAFCDVYGNREADYKLFEQTNKSSKVIILDDAHRIREEDFKRLISYLDNKFEYIIFGVSDGYQFDLIERIKQLVENSNTFYRYRILPFFADKRRELVSKIVDLKIDDEDEREKIVDNLCENLNRQRLLANYSPNFIIMFVIYYLKNLSELSQNDGETFSKVFEMNLVGALKPHLKRTTLDKALIVLDKVAYYIHSNRAYPLNRKTFEQIIEEYNNDYDADIVPSQFINNMVSSKIISEGNDGSELNYRFCNKSYLAYFVARELLRRYNEEHDSSMLLKVLHLSCFGINADIILFITFLTNDSNVLQFILDQSEAMVGAWEEFSIAKQNIPYLFEEYACEVESPDSEMKEANNEHDIAAEKKDAEIIETTDIYDYNEEEAEIDINQMVRAFSLLSVISKALPAFEHMLKSEKKKRFVDAIYRIPNKIFYKWAKIIDDNFAEFKEEIIKADYSRIKPITDEKAETLIQWVSTSVLLDLYDMSSRNASRATTIKYINDFDYIADESTEVQHLIMLEHAKKYQEFEKESNSLFEKTPNFVTKLMIRRIVQHVIINATKLPKNLEQIMKQKYFSPSKQRQILMLKNKTERQKS